MPWNDAPQFEAELRRALNAFNWSQAEKICAGIIERIRTDPELLPESSGKRLMNSLRRKRRFQLMTRLAEALMQSGLRTPPIRRQYAQALIDQGILAAGEMVLQTIIQDPMGFKVEELEARGLTGRIYKQIYVNNNDPKSPRNRDNLERALKEYLYVYRLDPSAHLWHGINVVALTDRARRDQLSPAGLPDARALSQDILKALVEKAQESVEDPPAYDVATEMEAHLALGNHEEAARSALRYADCLDADAFELNSTIRQLTEVWQLNYGEAPGNHLLPILKAGHLAREGATADRHSENVTAEAEAVGHAVKDLEAIFGPDRMVTLKWYQKGLEQCKSIARIEKRSGKGHGTGWLVNAADFFPKKKGLLLLTNNHVVSDVPNPLAILPDDSQVNFQTAGQVMQVKKEVVWKSDYTRLDATFLQLKGKPKGKALELHDRPMQMSDPPPRLYAIGHPQGRDLEISLQDNYLVACNDTLVHYRTPTEPGNSGSPIFEPEDWRVVALHHKGKSAMPRIDGKEGTYEANEGISILALQKETRQG